MPSYIPILDTEIDPESPGTQSLFQRLRDNPLAIVTGGPGAPSISPSLLSVGGSGADGTVDDTWAPTIPGYYDWLTSGPSVLSTGRTWPWFMRLRALGNLSISASMRVDGVPITMKNSGTNVHTLSPGGAQIGSLIASWNTLARQFGLVGESGKHDAIASSVYTATNTGGGACVGDGIDALPSGLGGVGMGAAALFRRWAKAHPLFGGPGGIDYIGGTYNKGGGCLVLMVDGDLDMTGGTLDASGYGSSDGGAAGSILVYCTGTLTDGTFKANGAPGGGGGYVAVVASAYAGAQTLQANAGTGAGAGVHEKITLAAELIRGLLWGP